MKDRFEGAMLGLAVGDALGFPVEFINSDEIRRRYGTHGLTDFVQPHSHEPGTYSDDTQMSLAMARALLDAGDGSVDDVMRAIGRELVAWAESPENDRAPGSTTMSACRKMAGGRSWRESGVPESKGCGSTIRTAPIGLYYHRDAERLAEMGAHSSVATHGHPCAVAGAVVNARAVALALKGARPQAILDAVLDEGGRISREFAAKVGQVPEVLAMPPDGAFDILGDAWVAEEAIACALYCFLRSPDDFSATVLTGANASGDSDSIASIAGGISGAYNGIRAIPERWRNQVENSELLATVARELYEATRPP